MGPVVSANKTLSADLLNPASCEVEPPWTAFVGPAHAVDQSVNLEAKAKP